MLGSYPINFDKDTQDWTYSRGVFNASYWLDGTSISLAYLLENFAQLHTVNTYTNTNYFVDLNFSGSLNGITQELFALIADIPNILAKLTNFVYYPLNETTYISNNVYADELGIAGNLACQNAACQGIAAYNIRTSTIATQSLKAFGDIECGQSITAKSAAFESDVCLYLTINNSSFYPLNKSITNITSAFAASAAFTNIRGQLKAKYGIQCFSANGVITLQYKNTSNDWVYDLQIPASTTKINIFVNGHLL
jgi:hypothetical protein